MKTNNHKNQQAMTTQTKTILTILGVTAATVGGYFIFKNMNKPPVENETFEPIETTTTTPVTTTSPKPKPVTTTTPTATAGVWPLKYGQKNNTIALMQNALNTRFGINPKLVVDGIYGAKTKAALMSKGLPTEVTKITYSTITGVPYTLIP